MKISSALNLCILFALSPLAAFCQKDLGSAETNKICQQHKSVEFPAKDRPTAAEKAALAKCGSEDLYYGLGVPADPVKARKCAYAEMAQGPQEDGEIHGRVMLIVIYANGEGADRNFDLAVRLACEAGGAPAEIDGRVAHLVKLKNSHWNGSDFSLCDDTTSGYMEGWCARLDEATKSQERKEKTAAIVARWKPAESAAFTQLQKAADEFIKARSANEVDLSGTGRVVFQIEEEAKQRDALLAALQQFEAGRLPKFSAAEFAKADADLNAVYRTLQRDNLDAGTINKKDIKETQRIWLRYRDAWVVFGQMKYPSVSADGWKTWLTQERTQMLKGLQEWPK